jgi:hypothetical protein
MCVYTQAIFPPPPQAIRSPPTPRQVNFFGSFEQLSIHTVLTQFLHITFLNLNLGECLKYQQDLESINRGGVVPS